MRVLHVISGDLWAGAEAQALALLVELDRLVDVEVTAALMNEGALAERLRAAGISVTVLHESRASSLRIVLELRRLMNSWRPDVVHTHRTKENVLGSIANAIGRRAVCVRTVHGSDEGSATGFRGLVRSSLATLNVWTGRWLQDRIVAVSAELAARLRTVYGSDHVTVIENGVDTEALLKLRPLVALRASDPLAVHVGFVGRVVPVKRVDIFVEVAARLCNAGDGRWFFHVIGDGPLLSQMKNLARHGEVGDRVAFYGHREDAASMIAALDVMMICSDHEGLPMCLLEAMALGTAVVAHDTGGIAAALGSSGNGFVVSPNVADAYVAALKEMRGCADLARRTWTRARAKTEYSASRNAKRMAALYQSLLADG